MIIKITHVEKNFFEWNFELTDELPTKDETSETSVEMFNVCFPELFFVKSIQKSFSEYITLGRSKFEFEQDLPSLYRPAR